MGSLFWRCIMKQYEKPRQRRMDLINSMPCGQQKQIASQLKCSKGQVSSVLNGYRSHDTDLGRNIIRLAERSAALEAGKRFMKSKY